MPKKASANFVDLKYQASNPSGPAATYGRLFVDNSGNVLVKLNGDAVTTLATTDQVAAAAAGLNAKALCKWGTTGNVTLSGLGTQANGEWTGTLTAGQRIAALDQTLPEENGIYLAASGGWTRATDMDTWAEVPGAYFFIEQGATLADTAWICTSDTGGTLGTTAITFVQFGAGGVTSVFGRTGAVVATDGDYDESEVAVTAYDLTSSTDITVDYTNGSFQRLTLAHNTTLTPANIPNNKKLWVLVKSSTTYTIAIHATCWNAGVHICPPFIDHYHAFCFSKLGGAESNQYVELERHVNILNDNTPKGRDYIIFGDGSPSGASYEQVGRIYVQRDGATGKKVWIKNADDFDATGWLYLGGFQPLYGSGSPEGVTTADIGAKYQDTTNGYLYIKMSGSGNTGWVRSALLTDTTSISGTVTVTQGTPGDAVQVLKSTATNDDPTVTVVQNRIAVTDATVTTLHTFATTSDTVAKINAVVIARRTGGSAGTAGDGAGYELRATFKNIGGTVTQIGSTTTIADEDQVGWDCYFEISGTNVLLRFVGATDNNVTVHLVEGKFAQLGS